TLEFIISRVCSFLLTIHAVTDIYTLSLHDALPIWHRTTSARRGGLQHARLAAGAGAAGGGARPDGRARLGFQPGGRRGLAGGGGHRGGALRRRRAGARRGAGRSADPGGGRLADRVGGAAALPDSRARRGAGGGGGSARPAQRGPSDPDTAARLGVRQLFAGDWRLWRAGGDRRAAADRPGRVARSGRGQPRAWTQLGGHVRIARRAVRRPGEDGRFAGGAAGGAVRAAARRARLRGRTDGGARARRPGGNAPRAAVCGGCRDRDGRGAACAGGEWLMDAWRGRRGAGGVRCGGGLASLA